MEYVEPVVLHRRDRDHEAAMIARAHMRAIRLKERQKAAEAKKAAAKAAADAARETAFLAEPTIDFSNIVASDYAIKFDIHISDQLTDFTTMFSNGVQGANTFTITGFYDP